ncbi:sulfite exporter TauE/SafE family protein, partial [Singulisphaera rosea]
TVALFPGSLASAWAYRDDFAKFEGLSLPAMLIASLAGGLVGAILLLVTPQTSFDGIAPWLLLVGTLTFAFGKQAGAWLRRWIQIGPKTLVCGQFLLGIYGGYFGGAVGIMTMAALSLLGHTDITAMNAAKTLIVGTMNSVAVVCFIIAGKVWWLPTLTMLLGAVLGGYSGARVARRLDPRLIRIAITLFNVVITTVFFLRASRRLP